MQRILGPTHLDTIKARVNIVHYYVMQGDYNQALPIAEEARRLSKLSLGEQHPTTINSLQLLAAVYDAVRPVHESLPLQLEVLAQIQHVLGEDHPKTLQVMLTTAMAYLKNDNETEAIGLLETASPALITKLGENHATSIECMMYLGNAYLLANRPKEALALLEEIDRPTPSSGLPQVQKSQGKLFLAEALLRTGQQEEGVEILEQVLQLQRKQGADDPLAVADALAKISYAYLNAGMFVEAEPYLRESFDLLRANTTPDNWLQFAVQSAWGASLAEQGKYEDAEPLLLSGGRGLLAERVEPPYPSPRKVADAVRRIIRFYELTEQPDQADKWRQTAELKLEFRP